MRSRWSLRHLLICCLLGLAQPARGQVVINEIMYHPVEQPTFTADGHPVLDLTEDVHEYIELFNAGSSQVNLSGWRLTGGIQYTFPQGVTLAPTGALVVAKDPARLLNVTQYALNTAAVFGPYLGQLRNSGDSIQLQNAASHLLDAVSYSDSFPWPSAADGLGASQRWTGIDPMTAQYRGRSLERLSALHSGSDPANWRASPWPGEPSPARANPGQGQSPPPVVTSVKVAQVSDGQPIIGTNQPARIEVTFSAADELGAVRLEYFLDDVNRTDEPKTIVAMTANERVFSATLPGFRARTVVRYRVWAELLLAGESAPPAVVLPRGDDAYAWRGYFVTPPRQTTNTVAHHILISTNATRQLNVNLNDNPLSGFNAPLGTEPNAHWNETQPAVMGHNGQVYDIHVRHSGSYWRRSPGLRSYKVELPQYSRIDGKKTLLLLAKDSINALGYRIYEAAGLPTARTRWVELYFLEANFDGMHAPYTRLDIDEHDEVVFERYQKLQASLHPDQPVEPLGLVYKSSGLTSDVGPYGLADGRALQPNAGWTPLQRYEWNYSSKLKDWMGYLPLQELCEQLADARGPGPGLDLPTLRSYLEANWDLEAMLTYLSIRNWMGAVDDTHHNYFVWRQANGRWSMLGWDLDSELGQTSTNRSIFNGENGNHFKDSVLQAFREEYKQKLYWLNNTLLDPENLMTLGIQIPEINSFGVPRQAYVNGVLGYGPFHKPRRPTPLSPLYGESVSGVASCQASPYTHSLQPAPAHASTLWRLREADTAERALIYSVTSAVHLTSLPIPFAALETGRRYSWQCVYYDTNAHPSPPTTEAEFRFGGSYQRRELVKIDSTTTWRHSASSTNLGSAWRAASYDDASWSEGPALLGVSGAALAEPIRTALPLGRRYYYFRKRFALGGDPARTSIRLRHIIDDGAIFYLNGAEISRTNITIFSTVGTEISDPIYTGQIPLGATNLVAGENVIAVELQQFHTNSADVVFGLSIEATTEVGGGSVRLNEVMAMNRSAVPHNGFYPDWIELYNAGAEPVSLNGYSLTDDPLVPLKFMFPADTQIASQGFLVVWCDSNTLVSGLHTGFSLRAEGESIQLLAPGPSGPMESDRVTFGLQLADRSIARASDGTGAWQLANPTPSGPNEPLPLGSAQALRINEWMASPTSGPDWFELFNPELQPVAIGGFFLTDDLGAPTNSPIPALSFLDGWSFRKFIADSDLAAGADHVSFKLSAGGETIALFDPSHSLIDSVQFDTQTTGVSQGRLPDGSGPILSLLNGATPGVANSGDADADGMPNAFEQAHQLNPLSSLDAALDFDGDGLSNFGEYLAGTNPRASEDALKFESIGWGAAAPGAVQLTFRLLAGKVYEIQFRQDLSQGAWEPLAAFGPESANRTVTLTDPRSTGRFYRLVLKRA